MEDNEMLSICNLACRLAGKIDAARQENQMLREIIERLHKIHPPKYQHLCHEWDGMNICEYDPEFIACTCFDNTEGRT